MRLTSGARVVSGGDRSLTGPLADGVIASLAHQARDAHSAAKLVFAHAVHSSSQATAVRLAKD